MSQYKNKSIVMVDRVCLAACLIGVMGLLSGCPVHVITIVIPGDFSRFGAAQVRIAEGGGPLVNYPVELTDSGALILFSGSPGNPVTVAASFETGETEDAFGQAVTERQQAQGSFVLPDVAEVPLNGIGEAGALEWTGRFHVSRDGVTAVFPVDPCELFAALIVEDGGEACQVDSDRALYEEPDPGGTLLTFVLGQDVTQCSYDGGNIFSSLSAEDVEFFAGMCDGGMWKSADALTCYVRDNSIHCLFFDWDNAP